MRYFLILIGFVIGLASPLAAQNKDIEATIGAQFDAFKADDFNRAFSFASPGIQDIFRTPENFGRMVTNGYPMVHRPADIRYLDLHEENGALWQRVQVTDGEGRLHMLDYQMTQQENGWKINAVELVKLPQANA